MDRTRILLLGAVLVVGVAVRLVFSPVRTPDSDHFLLVGANLATHACLSDSPVEGGACAPAWTQQPPGYASFVAVLRLAGVTSGRAISAVQTLLFALAIGYFAHRLWLWHRDGRLLLVAMTVPLFSPMTIGDSRMLLTELLSGAAVVWVLAEVARSAQESRVRMVPLAVALSAALLLRWDLIWLVPAVMVGVGASFGWRRAAWPVAVVTVLSGVPYVLLLIRAVVVGLPPTPSALAGEASLPTGIVAFYRTAGLDQRATVNLLWPVLGREYHTVNASGVEMYAPGVPEGRLRAALDATKALPDGSAVPAELNEAFATLARDASADLGTRLSVPFIRAARLVWGWAGHPVRYSSVGVRQPLKAFFVAYSLSLVAAFPMAVRLATGPLHAVGLACGVFLGLRLAFLVLPPISGLETRYVDLHVAAIELLAVHVLWLAAAGSVRAPVREVT